MDNFTFFFFSCIFFNFKMRRRKLEKSFKALVSLLFFYTLFALYFLLKFTNQLRWDYLIYSSNYKSANQLVSFEKPDWNSTKLILLWNGFYKDPPTLKGWKIETNGIVAHCKHHCAYTTDKNLLKRADAVVFHGDETLERYGKPKWRSPDQVYVFFFKEPPYQTRLNLHNYRNFFNWTATYRKDSDIFHPYGRFYPINEKDVIGKYKYPYNTTDTIKRKKKLLVWLVSNCDTPSDRESYVRELSKYIQVDIFGSCGQDPSLVNCNKTGLECMKTLGKNYHYKFYLSLENSFCEDYITEKIFRAFGNGMVPVVYGFPGVYQKFIPNGSYIDITKFKNPQQLAEYLHYLDVNEDEYRKFFDWRKDYVVSFHTWNTLYCELCDDLYTFKHRKDIHKWWHTRSNDHSKDSCIHLKKIGWKFYDFKVWLQSL